MNRIHLGAALSMGFGALLFWSLRALAEMEPGVAASSGALLASATGALLFLAAAQPARRRRLALVPALSR